MLSNNRYSALILGICMVLGLGVLGYFFTEAVDRFKGYERTVTVKGLSEREYPADEVIWPISFRVAGNDLTAVYEELDQTSKQVQDFLAATGLKKSQISLATPNLTDKLAQA